MKENSKKPRKDTWKDLLLLLEAILLTILTVYIFTDTYENRPEKSRIESSMSEVFLKDHLPDYNTNYLFIPDAKGIPEPPSFQEIVAGYVFDICKDYPNVDPYLVLSVIYQESRFVPDVSLGGCVGLMQISERWHQDRADRLGVTDFWDPYSNVLLGIDLLSELLTKTDGDIYYALMQYNQTFSSARQMYLQGIISDYARDVVRRADEYREVFS